MWKIIPGIPLSLLPRRWRRFSSLPDLKMPWVAAAILSGILESIFAVAGLIAWYAHLVTTSGRRRTGFRPPQRARRRIRPACAWAYRVCDLVPPPAYLAHG